MPTVIAIVGPPASGKSSLATELQRRLGGEARCQVLSADDHFKRGAALSDVPTVDLRQLPWPGQCPSVFLEPRPDHNVPEAIDWFGLRAELSAVTLRDLQCVIIEGFLLQADIETMALVDHVVAILVDTTAGVLELEERKFVRSHLGKLSYRDRGVTREDYHTYHAGYVWARAQRFQHLHVLPAGGLRLPWALSTAAMADSVLHAYF